MNKEQLRKELEDCWGKAWNHGYFVGTGRILNDEDKEAFITTRLAALDDVDDGRRAVKEFSLVLYRLMKSFNDVQRNEQQEKRWKEAEYILQKNYSINDVLRVDDGQEGNDERKKHEGVARTFRALDVLAEQLHTTKKLLQEYKKEISDGAALPVADGEGQKVRPAPEKLEHPNDLIKSLNWCKNLLSSITAAAIAGRDLDFVKHGTPFFEEMLMAYKSAKAVLAKPLPAAVTGGVKWVKASERLPEYRKDFQGNKASDDVLIFVNGEVHSGYLEAVRPDFKKLIWSPNIGDDCLDIEDYHGAKVTHWMPLPNTPSESQPAHE